MNARTKDALDETLILSYKYAAAFNSFPAVTEPGLMVRIIQDLISEMLVDVGALYKASEAV
jgi:DNA mismatch repair protein MSH4